jgi:hypothetical protein
MKYDAGIDDSIIRCLNKKGSLHTNGLYKLICSSYKKVSFDAFNRHRERLLSDQLIDRTFTGIGKKTKYCLSEKAKRQLKFKILELKSEKWKGKPDKGEEQERMILFILLLLFRQRSIYKFDTTEELERFLLRFNLTTEQFISSDNLKPLYTSIDRSERYQQTFWISPSDVVEVNIKEIIYRKDSTGKLRQVVPRECYYYCTVKGLTIQEILGLSIYLWYDC